MMTRLGFIARLFGVIGVLAACGSTNSSRPNTAGSGGEAAEPGDAGNGGRSPNGGRSATGGQNATGGQVGGGSSRAGSGGIDPGAPLDPSVFPGSGTSTPPRTTGSRSEPLPRPSCPETEPDAGDACSVVDEQCSYGNAVQYACRTVYQCAADGWVALPQNCTEPPANFCPATMQPGAECTPADVPPRQYPGCAYDTTVCSCPTCDVDWRCLAGTVWTCVAPPKDLDCPEVAPNLGEGCEEPAQRCAYGDPCHGGVVVFCRRGAWELEPTGCTE